MKHLYLLTILAMLICAVSCEYKTTGYIISDNDTEIIYTKGRLTFVDKLYDTDVYPEGFEGCTTVPSLNLSFDDDTVISASDELIFDDSHTDAIGLCRDPVCDHSMSFTCIESYDPNGGIINVDGYIYFRKTCGIYRYSLDTLTTELYALFNKQVLSMFRMGKFLYIWIDYGTYIKVDLTDDRALVIDTEHSEYPMVIPYNGELYFLDTSSNIWRGDQNFGNIQLLVSDRKFDSFISYSYQLACDKLWYLDKKDDIYRLCAYELESGDVSYVAEGVYCFSIWEDSLYVEIYDPQDGPEFRNSSGDIITTTESTGGRIYRAPLGSPSDLALLCEFHEEDKRLDGYYLYATGRYIYAPVSEFENYGISTRLYRFDMNAHEWENIAEYGS